MNSFVYLMNHYPSRYGNRLYGGYSSPESARDALQFGWVDPWGQFTPGMGNASGVWSLQAIWEKKTLWIDHHAPGTTEYDGMIWYPGMDLTTWRHGEVLDNRAPTLDFMRTELEHGEDVEIAFEWLNITSTSTNWEAHAVTLTSVEGTRIDYLDPNNPSVHLWADTWMDQGFLHFAWDNGNNTKVNDVLIYYAFSESPLPDGGSTAVLIMIGVAVLWACGGTVTSREVRAGA